ncbi:MAG: DNA mismatch repair protein MutS [Wujia sp.]
MINDTVRDEILSFRDEYIKRQRDLEKGYSRMSAYRALTFLAGLCLLLIGISDGVTVAGIGGILLLLIFVVLIKLHSDIANELESVQCKLLSVENYILRYGEKWREIEDDGADFLTKDMTIARDIDLLGKSSLYQLINVCHTDAGRKLLVHNLVRMEYVTDPEDTRAAIDELLSDTEGAIEYEAVGIELAKHRKKFNYSDFIEYCASSEIIKMPMLARLFSIALPVVEILLIVLGFAGIISPAFGLIGFLVLLSYSELTKTVTLGIISPVCNISPLVENYLQLLHQIGDKEYHSKKLTGLKSRACGALMAFGKLNILSQAYNISYNPFLYIVMNGLFLWNYRLAELALRWKKCYAENAADCFGLVGEMEYLQSLTVLARIRKTCWAYIDCKQHNTVSLKGEELYHPLISPDRVVANSAEINGGITIITGSNMSGKTTFLRTLAINLILAYIGAPICGKSFRADYMRLFTSMRVMDDVAGGISTFYAEILRIKEMAEYRNYDEPMLCLIDEIFKGTNSADRIVGAQEAIKRLSGDKCMVVVSTHDFELCALQDERGKAAVNFHFEEFYEDEKLQFDYRIKEGRCTTTNARAILRMAGFDV